MKMKKMLMMMLTILMVVSLIVGCASNTNKKDEAVGDENDQGSANTDSDNGGVVPESAYPESLTYWMPLNNTVASTISDMNEVGAYRALQELTGTKIEFKLGSSDGTQSKEQFNLMIASQSMTDVIEYNWLTIPGGPENAINQGTIVKLNDLIDQHAPSFKKYLQDHPDIANMIKTDEGSIYSFPFIRGNDKLMVFFGPVMRQDWLDQLNLEAPTTIDEWEGVLTAFRDGDPNGNNEKDEIPYLINLDNVRSPALNEMIGAWGIAAQFYQVDGKVKYGEIQAEFKDYLTTMRRWYEEGLIDPDFAATDSKLKDAKVTDNKLGALFTYNGSGIGNYTGLMKDKNPEFELVGVSHPTLEEGATPLLGQIDKAYGGLGAAVSTNAKNPEQIVKWLDMAYSEEGHMLFNFGIEGESYNRVDGYPTYSELITDNPDGLPMAQAMGQNIRASYNGPFVQDVRYIEQYYALDAQTNALETWSNAENDIMLPPVTLTADESKELASIMGDANTYAQEMYVKFIMGGESLDNFDQFVSTMKSFGIEEAVNIQQAALDRYNAR